MLRAFIASFPQVRTARTVQLLLSEGLGQHLEDYGEKFPVPYLHLDSEKRECVEDEDLVTAHSVASPYLHLKYLINNV